VTNTSKTALIYIYIPKEYWKSCRNFASTCFWTNSIFRCFLLLYRNV